MINIVKQLSRYLQNSGLDNNNNNNNNNNNFMAINFF